jgi:NADH-quinone oxidoreductase subunit C
LSSVDEAVTEAPTDERRAALAEVFAHELGTAVAEQHLAPGRPLWLRVQTDAWLTAARVARHKARCGFFDWLSAIDWMPSPYGRDMDSQVDLALAGSAGKEAEAMVTGVAGGETRFQVFTHLWSLERGVGVIIKADVPDDTLAVDSIIPAYAGASWHEREAWEMYGIDFIGHPDMRHLYLPSDFEGHPLRKDFPLLARRIKPWPGIVDVEGMPPGMGGDDEAGGDDV